MTRLVPRNAPPRRYGNSNSRGPPAARPLYAARGVESAGRTPHYDLKSLLPPAR